MTTICSYQGLTERAEADTMTNHLDATDLALIRHLRREPRAAITRLASLLGVARGTVQTRLQRLTDRGVIHGYGPEVDAAHAGFGVLAFTTLAIAQGAHDRTVEQLREIPELIEIHTVTGAGDLFCRIVARSNDHLHAILQEVVAVHEVTHTETQLALSSPVQRTVADLLCHEAYRP